MSVFVEQFLSNAEIFLKTLAAAGAFIAFGIGILQYRRAQLWKRKEFLGNEVKAFFADPSVHNALLMVDWGSRRICFDPKADRSAWPKVTRDVQVGALLPHTFRLTEEEIHTGGLHRFSEVEAEIRDTYDLFLEGLTRLNAFVESELFEAEELYPYFNYWFREMTTSEGAQEDVRWRLALLGYIHFYGFKGVQRLLRPLVGDITVGGPIWQVLRTADPALAADLEAACHCASNPGSALPVAAGNAQLPGANAGMAPTGAERPDNGAELQAEH